MSSAAGGRRLAPDFEPGPFDVICGRGKSCYQHEGNRNLGELILRQTEVYAQSKTKDEKSAIVSSIVAEVRRLSPNGGFVKREEQGWSEVGSFLAREKISQVFRNILQDQYKSSTNMRRVVRQAQRQFLRARKTKTDGTTATPGAGGCDDKNATTGTSIHIDGVPADRRKSNKAAVTAEAAKALVSTYAALAPKLAVTARPVTSALPTAAGPICSTVPPPPSSSSCALDPIKIDEVFGAVSTPDRRTEHSQDAGDAMALGVTPRAKVHDRPDVAGENVATGHQRRHDEPLSASGLSAGTTATTTATTTTTTTTASDLYSGLMVLHEAAKILQPLQPSPSSSPSRHNGATAAVSDLQQNAQDRHDVYSAMMIVDPLPFERVFFLPPMEE